MITKMDFEEEKLLESLGFKRLKNRESWSNKSVVIYKTKGHFKPDIVSYCSSYPVRTSSRTVLQLLKDIVWSLNHRKESTEKSLENYTKKLGKVQKTLDDYNNKIAEQQNETEKS